MIVVDSHSVLGMYGPSQARLLSTWLQFCKAVQKSRSR